MITSVSGPITPFGIASQDSPYDLLAGAISDPLPANNASKLNLIVEFGTLVTGGSVVLEAAPTKDYTGQWAPVMTIAFGDVSGAAPKLIQKQDTSDNVLPFVRVRVIGTDATKITHCWLGRRR